MLCDVSLRSRLMFATANNAADRKAEIVTPKKIRSLQKPSSSCVTVRADNHDWIRAPNVPGTTVSR